MRRTVQLCRLGVAGVATAVVLSACGGSGGSTAASSSSGSTTTSTSSAPPAAAAGGDFCSQARNFAAEVQSSVGSTTQQQTAGQQFQQLVAQLQKVSPPAEIAADWRTALSALQAYAQAFATATMSDPQALAALQQQLAPAEQQLTTAGQHIDAYLQTTCGITSAPTS